MLANVSTPVERCVVLRGVSWRFYESLLEEIGESPGTRVTYDNGLLQIRVASAAQDKPNRTLAEIVAVVAEEMGIEYCPVGSTTFRRPDLLKGFEPDSSYYFRNAEFARLTDDIDLTVDPPPELVIEVDRTHDSLDRFPTFAAVGVAEVWRYAGGLVTMHALRGDGYEPIERNATLPVLSAHAATRFLEESRRLPRLEWLRRLRDWVRSESR